MSNNKPIQTFKFGSLQGAVWENEVDRRQADGSTVTRTFETIDLSRRYTDKNGQWQDANSYSFQQLLLLRELIDDAIAWWKPRIASGNDQAANDGEPFTEDLDQAA